MPFRTCVLCRKESAKRELVRFVVGVGGALKVDLTQVENGRGAYSHAACLLRKDAQRLILRSFRRQKGKESNCVGGEVDSSAIRSIVGSNVVRQGVDSKANNDILANGDGSANVSFVDAIDTAVRDIKVARVGFCRARWLRCLIDEVEKTLKMSNSAKLGKPRIRL